MPTEKPDLRPIQVLLDTTRFIGTPEPQPFPRSSKDFFKGNNQAFAAHKKQIQTHVESIAKTMRKRGQAGGFVKVKQREQAIAKSHRPLNVLFSEKNEFSFVGVDEVGELLFQATPSALEQLADVIEEKAELQPKRVVNARSGKAEMVVSPHRSELGGIEAVFLYGAKDKLKFSPSEAVAWIRSGNVIGGYIVELFKPDRFVNAELADGMIASLRSGLNKIPGGVIVRPLLPSALKEADGEPSLVLSVRPIQERQRLVELPFDEGGNPLFVSETSLPDRIETATSDLDVDRHAQVLSFLSEHALVRSIELPPMLETTPAAGSYTLDDVEIEEPVSGADYPVIAVVDGGVSSSAVGSWKIDDAGLIPATDRDESHGTFIAGLICAASVMNPELAVGIEPTGCKIYDLDLFPRRDLRSSYYRDLEELFDVLEEKIKVAKRDHGVRVFNLSFAIGTRDSRLSYSRSADRLDRIARANDVIFVVAAGNLGATSSRPPWPAKAEDAATMLAGIPANSQFITAPSDHLLGLTVGAVNPPGVPPHHPLLPTTYTRSGPGVGGSRKPELCHYGGVETNSNTGLVSLTPHGRAICNCGTSFAAPLTAATVGTLDQRLGGSAPRELILALPVHRAERAQVLERAALRHIAREYVGFGLAPVADALLQDDPHSVTLVFSGVLLRKQRLEFGFAWPQSLVSGGGVCRGRAELTVCYTPPIDPSFREEAMRVQIEARLQQERLDGETGESTWEGRLTYDASAMSQAIGASEAHLISTGLKWSPVKRYQAVMQRGRGNSSNWRLCLESLTRGGFLFPEDGVPFTVVLTIRDLAKIARVREEMRFALQTAGVALADITVAHRVRPRRF